ncbi:MAG: tRNA (adenosine(37)-N6)-threonylcarbamoyltransferase complex dimerization subunit type 1 TsaB [Lentisphaerae bacterium]|nr:tRNA (adenosine(37)-N6)-threonylcarbamoyltransferase complex dimerization subunit type 1 TsaB [Lentisphaerota bacterium]
MLLALEQSTEACGLAVLEGGAVRLERSWSESRYRHDGVFAALESLRREGALDPAGLDAVAVGLGPGSYSGLRVALAAAHGTALPGGVPVVGVSSAEALAWGLRREEGAAAVTVIGDARRGRLWLATFDTFARACTAEDFKLIPAAALAGQVPRGSLVASADAERLRESLAAVAVRPAAPTAAAVGRLAAERLAGGIPLPPPAPFYLHPPVFVSPG